MNTNIKIPTRLLAIVSLPVAAALAAPQALAGEAIFSHTYLSEVLPKGEFEVEQWLTYRDQKSQGDYSLWQSRTEVEYGISDRWQVSLYANAYRVNAQNDNSIASRNNFTAVGDGDEVSGGGPVTFGSYVPFAERLPLPSSRYQKSDFESISLESIYQFLSPYKDALGLSGYVEYTKGSKVEELELKLLAQKNYLEDKLILAANVAVEFENEGWADFGPDEKETELLLTSGASYQVAPGLRLGLELRNERSYEGAHSLSSGNRDYSAWFAGPTIHYAGKISDLGFFVTASYQTQLPWADAYSVASEVELVNGRVYKGTEKNVARVLFGLSF